jgi:MATE family multidrug resistance protein
MIFSFIFYWIIAIPVGYLVAFIGRVGAPGIWAGLALGLFVSAIAEAARLWWLTHHGNRFMYPVASHLSAGE